MTKQSPLPTGSPFRQVVDQLLEELVTSLLAALNPMERAFLRGAITRRGWDSAALSRSGLLSGVSDAGLLVLLEQLSDRIDQAIVEHGAELGEIPNVSAAFDELKRSIAAGR